MNWPHTTHIVLLALLDSLGATARIVHTLLELTRTGLFFLTTGVIYWAHTRRGLPVTFSENKNASTSRDLERRSFARVTRHKIQFRQPEVPMIFPSIP